MSARQSASRNDGRDLATMANAALACRGPDAERRRQPRASTSLRGAVQRGDGITLGCRTRDASLTGLFVELATDEPGLPEGSRVTVEFIVNEPTGTRRFHADATVVRSADHGVGLEALSSSLTRSSVRRRATAAPCTIS